MGTKKTSPQVSVTKCDDLDITTKYIAPDEQFSNIINGVQNSYLEWIKSITGHSSIPPKNWRLQLNSALMQLEDLVITKKK